MLPLVLGLLLFLGIHSTSIVAPAWRDRTAARLGTGPWKLLYTVVGVIGFALIVWGYGQARRDPTFLYFPPRGLGHFALLLLVPVFPLLLAAYLPGKIRSKTKHPMLVATKLWALAHLMANGGLHDVVLFGSFLAWAVADRISLKRRPSQPVPGAPTLAGAERRGPYNDAIVVVAGLALYVVFLLWGHRALIGVSPMP